jgi:hypothetical protein
VGAALSLFSLLLPSPLFFLFYLVHPVQAGHVHGFSRVEDEQGHARQRAGGQARQAEASGAGGGGGGRAGRALAEELVPALGVGWGGGVGWGVCAGERAGGAEAGLMRGRPRACSLHSPRAPLLGHPTPGGTQECALPALPCVRARHGRTSGALKLVLMPGAIFRLMRETGRRGKSLCCVSSHWVHAHADAIDACVAGKQMDSYAGAHAGPPCVERKE